MEDTAGFDLNRAIADWHQRMSQSPAYRNDDLEELQAHLRDAVAALTERGLSEEEAFLVTIRRLGSHRALEPEFSRINAADVWLHRILWMVLGIQGWGIVRYVSQAFGMMAGVFAARQLPHAQVAGRYGNTLFGLAVPSSPAASLSLLGTVLMVATLCAALWFAVRRLDPRLAALQRRPGRLGWTAACFLLVGIAIQMLAAFVNFWAIRFTVAQGIETTLAVESAVNSTALLAIQTIGLAWLTWLLARRHLRGTTA